LPAPRKEQGRNTRNPRGTAVVERGDCAKIKEQRKRPGSDRKNKQNGSKSPPSPRKSKYNGDQHTSHLEPQSKRQREDLPDDPSCFRSSTGGREVEKENRTEHKKKLSRRPLKHGESYHQTKSAGEYQMEHVPRTQGRIQRELRRRTLAGGGGGTK